MDERKFIDRIGVWIINGTMARFLTDIIAIWTSFILLFNAPKVATLANEFEQWVFATVMVFLCILVLLPAVIRVLYLGYASNAVVKNE